MSRLPSSFLIFAAVSGVNPSLSLQNHITFNNTVTATKYNITSEDYYEQFAESVNNNQEFLPIVQPLMKNILLDSNTIDKYKIQISQEMLSATPTEETRRGSDVNVVTNTMSGGGAGYDYNAPWDIGWPDWASMIGGNHWAEGKKYKQNMWG